MRISDAKYLQLLKDFRKGSFPANSTLKRIIICDAISAEDGGPGSGNFGHKGRPGQRGGSGPGGGSSSGKHEKLESGEPESSKKQAAWSSKLSAEKDKILSQKQSDQALFAYNSGIADYDEAVQAMRDKTASGLVEKYYGIMEQNGDPTPDKPLSKQMDHELYQSIRDGKYPDYTSARIGMIREKTGQSEAQAQETYRQMDTWFGGSWSHANTDTLDRYIDQDDAYDGPIYRGMHFTQEEYSAFMQGKKPGERINMRGMNSSWTDNEEVAYTFYRNGERRVKLTCVKNRTAAPVSHLSSKGENEILAHSKAEWTILSISEGAEFTEIKVVETGSFMSDQKHDELKKKGSTHDAMPETNSGYKSLYERMQEQQDLMQVDPESEAFADELEKKYPNIPAVYKNGRNASSGDVDLSVFQDDGSKTVHDGDRRYVRFLKNLRDKGLSVKNALDRALIADLINEDTEDGGPGSGNWGHHGRPGQVGGSGKGGGKAYRGGRGDIAYHSSKHDFLNGLKGERQHEAQSWLQNRGKFLRMSGHENSTPEEKIMSFGSMGDRRKLMEYMSEARGWDENGHKLIKMNLTEPEQKLYETLAKKYGIDPTSGLADERDMENWDGQDQRTYLDLKSKAMSGATSGEEPPDELMYEAGLKERPKPTGPDLSWYDNPRSWRSSMMENYMQSVLNENQRNVNTKEDFAALNQRFLDRLKYEKPGSAAETTWGFRAMQNMRGAIYPDGYSLKKSDLDRLSDDEKARFLEVVNQFYPSYSKIESVDDITDRVIQDTERAISLMPLRKNSDKQAINDYVVLQEKILGGFEPTPAEQYMAAKNAKESAAKAAAQTKEDAEKAEKEAKISAWKSTHPPEVIAKMYHPETVAGVKCNDSGSMTHEEADNGRVNTVDDREHHINCQTCVYAYEMRLRGYNVQAKGNNRSLRSLQYNLSKNQGNGWINPETGESPESVQPEKRITDKTASKWLESVVGKNGERYTFSYCYAYGHSAHVVSMYRDSAGNLTIYDPQRDPAKGPTTFSGDELEKYLSGRIAWNSQSGGNWRPKVLRIDNALPRQEYCDTILEPGTK